MRFDELSTILETRKVDLIEGKVPGFVHLVWWTYDRLDIKDYFYIWAYERYKAKPPTNVLRTVQPYIDNNERLDKITAVDRPPTPEEKKRLEEAISILYKKDRILGGIILGLNKVYVGGRTKDGTKVTSKAIRTFAVSPNGDLLINLGYANACSMEQLVGVLAHEAMHISLKHHQRLKGRSPFQLANLATDAFINEDLVTRDKYKIGLEGGVVAKNKQVVLRFMHLDANSADIQIANPKDFVIKVDMTNKTWEQVFDIMKKSLQTPSLWVTREYEVGDIIYDTRIKVYGIIKMKNRSSWNPGDVDYSIEPITQDVAKQMAKEKYNKEKDKKRPII